MKNIRLQLIRDSQKGFAAIILTVFLTVILSLIGVAMAYSSLRNFEGIEHIKNSRRSFYLSESGVDDTAMQLRYNVSYAGNSSGEITPIGTYYSNVDRLGDIFDITTWAEEGETKRSLHRNITIYYDIAEVTTKATYMSDFFVIMGEGARIRGNVWTNDDFEVLENGVVEGNLYAGGKGSFAVNWVWDGVVGGDPDLEGGHIIDNPVTTEEIEGNLYAADSVKVSGPEAYVQGDVESNGYVWELFGGTIGGNIVEYADVDWEPIPVPKFNFSDYEAQAVINGTYFSQASSFENYLDGLESEGERRLPDSLYYIDNGDLKIEGTTPVYLDGTLIVEDNVYIYCEWYQNAINDLPAIIGGENVFIKNKFNFWLWNYEPAGSVNINGIVYAEKDIDLFRTFSDENIVIDGATWAGDDIFIGEHTFVDYNSNAAIYIEGFDFVNGISDIENNYWEELKDN